MTGIVTRFAPSPTGYLHLGHAYSAIFSYNTAKKQGGQFILRIEDIDPVRCKAEYVEGIFEDLAWLGLEWETPVRIQSEHMQDYQNAISRLEAMGVLYPCFCTRKAILEEVARAGYAPHGPEGTIYPGTCKNLPDKERKNLIAEGHVYALRLDLEAALKLVNPANLYWMEERGEKKIARPEILGDIVIARKDIGTSYHLSVVVDDGLQGITHVTRGTDLQYATHIQRAIQELLDLPRPEYRHHQLIKGQDGERLAKRDLSQTLKSLREEGFLADDIYSLIGIRPYK